MLTWLKWLLVLPAALAGWAIALARGLGVHSRLERACPKTQMISGSCVTPWRPHAEKAVMCGGAGLAAALIVLFTTPAAPTDRRVVALFAFAVGCGVGLFMAVTVRAYAEFVTTVILGFYVTWRLRTGTWDDVASAGGP